jgi:hypothetical protein
VIDFLLFHQSLFLACVFHGKVIKKYLRSQKYFSVTVQNPTRFGLVSPVWFWWAKRHGLWALKIKNKFYPAIVAACQKSKMV